MQDVFKKLIPEDIYKEIGAKGYERLMLGDSKRKILTVMFIDIIGFTTITEKLEPIRALMLLNIYFDGIGQIVYAHG
jgi:class 3 adenylate cyclase